VPPRNRPYFGEVWQADLDPTIGHEQAGIRPVVVVSADAFNDNPSSLVVVVPVTRKYRGNPFNILIMPRPGGLPYRSYAQCDMIRSISNQRLHYRIGTIEDGTMAEIGYLLRVLLKLP
jgi:mRNA interferase MazF